MYLCPQIVLIILSFRRPSTPKVGRKVPKPKKSLRKLKPKSKKPPRISKRPSTTKLQHLKKKKTTRFGKCYAGPNCTGEILFQKCTKSKCKTAGGKSWRSSTGCEKIGGN